MRVAQNLLWLVPGEVGGSEEYTVRLLEAWADQPPADIDLTLLVNSAFLDVPAYAALADRFPTVTAPTTGARRIARVVTDATWLPRQRAALDLDVLHHGGGTIPIGASGPSLLTVHDLQPLDHPGYFSWPKVKYIQYMLPRSVRRATRIATLTAFVAHDVQAKLGVPADRFVRVPPGHRAARPATAEERTAVRRRYRLVDDDGGRLRPFFLYPAITYPHKNHIVLVHAFAALHRRHPDAALVLTGGAGPEDDRLGAAVARLGIGDAVRRTGRIPVRDLEVLYQEATALTFVSRYEGTGQPVLEAMAAGCPVIASDATGLVETAGPGGLLVGPHDIDGWVRAMEIVLDDPAEREALVRRGTTAVARYDWATSAAALADAYRSTSAAAAAGADEEPGSHRRAAGAS